MVPVSDMLGLVLPRRSRTAPLLVGIDGRSRSGKSTLAALIARCIQEVVVVHTDDIAWHHSFFGWSDVLIEGVLRPLRRGGLPLSYTPQPWIERGRQDPSSSLWELRSSRSKASVLREESSVTVYGR